DEGRSLLAAGASERPLCVLEGPRGGDPPPWQRMGERRGEDAATRAGGSSRGLPRGVREPLQVVRARDPRRQGHSELVSERERRTRGNPLPARVREEFEGRKLGRALNELRRTVAASRMDSSRPSGAGGRKPPALRRRRSAGL